MPWQSVLETRDRLPAANLDDWYAVLLERAGDAGPFALAVLGGRLAATPGWPSWPATRVRCAPCGPPRR